MEKSSRDSVVKIDTSVSKTFLNSTLTPIASSRSNLEMPSRPLSEWNGLWRISSLMEELLNSLIG